MPRLTPCLASAALLAGVSSAFATDLIKADNASGLRTAGTYAAPNDAVAAPTSSDRVIFNSVFANTTTTITSGGALSMASLRVENPGHDVAFSLQNATTTIGTSSSSGSIDLSAATKNLTITNSGASGVFRLRGSAPTITTNGGVTLTINVPLSAYDGGTLTISGAGITSLNGVISNGNTGTTKITYAGSGTLVLGSALNTYTGATTVSSGTLQLGSGAAIGIANSASVTVSGGTLTNAAGNSALGAGAVLMSSGAITPGGVGSIGSFIVAAGQSFTSTGGTLNFDLSSGASFDQISSPGGGTFSISGTTLALSGAGTSAEGTYQLLSGFSGGGSVSLLTITGLAPGYTASLDNSGLLTVTLSSVPEPSTFGALAGLAGLAVAMASRRRR